MHIVQQSGSRKDDMKVDSPILGGAGLGAFMADPLFSEDDSSIVTTSHFSLCDPEESGLSLFGAGDSADVKADYSWDNCFGSLEDVDNLLSSDPDSTFGGATPRPGTLQWDDPSSPLDLQSESETRSSSIMPVETAKANFFGPKLEFVPTNNATFNEFQAPTNFDSEAKQQQSGGQVNSSEYLDDEKMMEVLTGSLPTSETPDSTSKDVAEVDSGPSAVSVSDSEKAKMAQPYRARRQAANRKRMEERTKRQLNHRKIFQAVPYAHSALQPMPMHMPAQMHQPPIHGYPVNSPALVPLQPMIRPYVRVGYNPPPPLHVISQVAPPQYVGYQQLPPPYQLRPPAGEVPILPPQLSTPTMTPKEKIEKLKFLQQMQARFAVEQQQQQFAAQGITPLDTSGSRKGVVGPVPPVKEVNADTKPSETMVPVSDSEFEPSLSVGQASVEVTSDDEGSTLEAAVLDQLQNTIKTQLELGTRMCIRDALYRLARSAMRRQASSGRSTGGDSANISQASQDADATSSGLEASINSDPSSSTRVSRMDMNGVETQTNPIDRSIAHLLFHKMQPQATPAQVDISRPTGFTVWNQAGNLTAPEMQPGTQVSPPMVPVSRLQDGSEQQRSGLSSEAVRESGELPAPDEEPVKTRNGPQKERLQRAIGLQELRQVLVQDVDTRSCKKESRCPPVSTSSGSSECQAGVFSQLEGGENTAMDESD